MAKTWDVYCKHLYTDRVLPLGNYHARTAAEAIRWARANHHVGNRELWATPGPDKPKPKSVKASFSIPLP